jgi:hypothetical protein
MDSTTDHMVDAVSDLSHGRPRLCADNHVIVKYGYVRSISRSGSGLTLLQFGSSYLGAFPSRSRRSSLTLLAGFSASESFHPIFGPIILISYA